MSTLLLRGGTVAGLGPADVAVQGDRIVAVGPDLAAYAGAAQVLDVRGRLVAPAFVDAHVHTVQTGFVLTRVDLRDARTREEVLDLVAAQARADGPDRHGPGRAGDVLLATGWDETRWPDATPPSGAELERAAPGRRVLLDRVDGHSSVVSPALADAVPGLTDIAGWSETGLVAREARHAVNATLAGLVGPEQRRAAADVACAHLARQGVAALHENAAPHIGPEYELELVRDAAADAGLLATLYWGELGALDTATRLGVAGLAGDLNVDGAVGSRTSALREAYADCAGHTGHAYLDAEQVAEHVVACTRAGLQAGFHCIGDAAMDAVAAGLESAARTLGDDALRVARHRLEHVEMPSPAVIATLARLGVLASVQPEFDALWGGPDQMYAERLGGRWRGMNPLGDLHRAGVPLAFGSDSPVTAGGPWASVRAAVHHHEAEQRLDVATALAAHTRGGWLAARIDDAGTVATGHAAHLAVWACAGGLGADHLPRLDPGLATPALRTLVVAGHVVVEDAA